MRVHAKGIEMMRILLRKNSPFERRGIYAVYEIEEVANTAYQGYIAAIKFENGKKLMIIADESRYTRADIFPDDDFSNEFLYEALRIVPVYRANEVFKGLEYGEE